MIEKEEKIEKIMSKPKKKQEETFNMVIDSDLKKQFYIKCVQNDTMMARVLKEYIEKYVEEN